MSEETSRTYVVGLPVMVTVSDDGSVSYDVDTSDVASCVAELDDYVGFGVDVIARDIDRISESIAASNARS